MHDDVDAAPRRVVEPVGRRRVLQQIQDVVVKQKAARVDITAYRAASLLSNGKTLAERDGIGRRRAEQIASLLLDAGLTAVTYQVQWQDAPAPDGLDDATGRRADIVVRD